MHPKPEEVQLPSVGGSKDGRGAADHDQPYRFGRVPNTFWPYPFSSAQFARLLAFKSRLGDDRRNLKNRNPDQEEKAA